MEKIEKDYNFGPGYDYTEVMKFCRKTLQDYEIGRVKTEANIKALDKRFKTKNKK